jgi:hypothetical protein
VISFVRKRRGLTLVPTHSVIWTLPETAKGDRAMKNKHLGSSFDDFLKEEGATYSTIEASPASAASHR